MKHFRDFSEVSYKWNFHYQSYRENIHCKRAFPEFQEFKSFIMGQCKSFLSIWVSFFSSQKVIIQKLLTNIYSHGRKSLQKVNYSNDVIFITWIIRMIRRHCTIINSNESYPQFQMNTLTNRKNNLITVKMLYIELFFIRLRGD